MGSRFRALVSGIILLTSKPSPSRRRGPNLRQILLAFNGGSCRLELIAQIGSPPSRTAVRNNFLDEFMRTSTPDFWSSVVPLVVVADRWMLQIPGAETGLSGPGTNSPRGSF